MNRYTITGLINDATNGATVSYVGSTMTDTRAAFTACERYVLHIERHHIEKVNRANGLEEITFRSGGSIQFHAAGKGITEVTGPIDVVYLDHVEVMDPLHAAFRAGDVTEIIRA